MAEKQVFEKDNDENDKDQPGESTSDDKLQDDLQDTEKSIYELDKQFGTATAASMPSTSMDDSEPGTSSGITAKDDTEHSQTSELIRELSVQVAWSEENMLKLVENMSGAQGGNAMLTTMSKEMLYPILKAIALMYPEWLAENQHKMAPNLFEIYCHQYALISEACEELEMEDAHDPEAVKASSERIMDLVHQIQECCNPPEELTSRVSSSYLQQDPTAFDSCLIM